MKKRCCILLFLFLLLASITSPAVLAAGTVDINHHWAKEYVEFLVEKGVWREPAWSFDPDRPIAREEALVWTGRLLNESYGTLSEAAYTNRTDFRSPAKTEIDQFAAEVDQLFFIYQRQASQLKIGHNLLFYLHLSASGKPMKEPDRYSDDWWLPANHLKGGLTREEASMILAQVIAPQVGKYFNLSGHDLEEKYTNLYRWKGESAFTDTPTLFATLLKDFPLFTSKELFQPKQTMSRGEYAVLLKRTYDLLEVDKMRLTGGPSEQERVANYLLTAATFAYDKGNADDLKRFFSENAIKQLDKIRPQPLHQYFGQLRVEPDKTDRSTIRFTGSYRSDIVGAYEVRYVLRPEASAPYHWVIDSVTVVQK